MKRFTLLLCAALMAITTGCQGTTEQTDSDAENPMVETEYVAYSVDPIPEKAADFPVVTVELSTSEETEVYTGDSWRDIQLLLINQEGNPGAVIFNLKAEDRSGEEDFLVMDAEVAPGQALTTIYIASSYVQHTVTAKAASEAGAYSLSFGPA